MRFIEIRGNTLMPVSNEEIILVEKIKNSVDPCDPTTLSPRESQVARTLVHRGVLSRVKIDGNNCLVYNDIEDI